MAIKLHAGADNAIVSAATRAGLAMTPGDYGKTFQAVANNYSATMKGVADMWGKIGDTVGIIAGEIGKNVAIEQGYQTKSSSIVNQDGQEFMYDMIKENKDEMKNSFRGKIKDENGNEIEVNPFSEEAKKYRRKLTLQKESYFKQIDDHIAVRELVKNEISAGNVDLTALKPEEAEMLNAITAYSTPEGKTSKGNHVRMSRDENTGELVYELYSPANKVPFAATETPDITGPLPKQKDTKRLEVNGQPVTITATQLRGLLVKPNNTLKSGFGAIGGTVEKNARQYGVEYDEHIKTKIADQVTKLIGPTPANLRQSMNTRINGRSFMEDLQTESPLSSSLFASLANVLPKDEKGNIKRQGVVSGINEMADGKPGISQQDLQNETNMKVLTYALVYDDKNYGLAKEIFTDWAVNQYKTDHDYGIKTRTNKSGGSGKPTVDLPWGKGVTINNQTERNQYNETMSFTRDLLNQTPGQTLRIGQDVWKRNKDNSYTLIETYQSGRLMPVAKDSQDTKTQSQMFQLLPRNKFSPTPDFLRQMQKINYPGPVKNPLSYVDRLNKLLGITSFGGFGGSSGSKTADDYFKMIK